MDHFLSEYCHYETLHFQCATKTSSISSNMHNSIDFANDLIN